MIVKSCRVENFASYKELDFDFQDKGLTLISGSTGSGKSTICDIIPWILFGRTAKGGNADEILSWPGDKITYASINVKHNGNLTQIQRTRGPKPKDNDLLYIDLDNLCNIRGKDLNDTQKLINQRLGLDYELYLSGAYFHEFSQTAQFFITTAKNRRSILEQLVDLSLAKTLQTNLGEAKKHTKSSIFSAEQGIALLENNLNNIEETFHREVNRAEVWQMAHKLAVKELAEKNDNFKTETTKKYHELMQVSIRWDTVKGSKVNTLEKRIHKLENKIKPEKYFSVWNEMLVRKENEHDGSTCTECGASLEHQAALDTRQERYEYDTEYAKQGEILEEMSYIAGNLQKEQVTKNPYLTHIEDIENGVNVYSEQLDKELAKVNPHQQVYLSLGEDVSRMRKQLNARQEELSNFKQTQSDLELLSDFTETYRGEVIKTTIEGIQDKTNELLTQHFDSEVQISLSIEGADKVEAIVTKDSNEAAYSQLSKGQRQLLKLCFGIAVMKTVQNHHAISFEQIFLDESLDGLDENFKLKAYGLLQSLALGYNSVFVVEHSSELKAQFENQMHVELTSEGSTVETK